MKYADDLTKVINSDGVNIYYKEEAARGTRLLYEKGLSPGGDSGDISIRDPKTGYVYISGSPRMRPDLYNNLGEYRASDMAIMTLDGQYVVPWATATIEAPMHLAIYRARPDVNAIVHTHAIWSAAFCIANQNIPLVLPEQQVHLGGEIVCAPCGIVGSEELADGIVDALGQYKFAAIMGNHGSVTVGDTLNEAFSKADFLEAVAKKVLLARMLGPIHEVSYENIFDVQA